MTSLRSLGIFLVLAGVAAATSPALQHLGVGTLLLGLALCVVYVGLARRRRRRGQAPRP